jgi:hypothetical protein
MGEKRNAYRVFMAKPEGGEQEYIDVGRRMILKWISEK